MLVIRKRTRPMLERIVEFLDTNVGAAIIAGAAGAVVRIVTLQERSYQAAGSLVVGTIMAVYAGPLAIPAVESVVGALSIDPESAAPLSGFIMGLGGIFIAQALLGISQSFGWKGRGGG